MPAPIAASLGGLRRNVQRTGAGDRLAALEVAASSVGRANTAGGVLGAGATPALIFSMHRGRTAAETTGSASSGGPLRPVPGGAIPARRRLANGGPEAPRMLIAPTVPALFPPVARDLEARGPSAIGPGSHRLSYESPGAGGPAGPVMHRRSRAALSRPGNLSLQRSLVRGQRHHVAIRRASHAVAPAAPLWPYPFTLGTHRTTVAPAEPAVVRRATHRQPMPLEGVRQNRQPASSGRRAQSSVRREPEHSVSAAREPSQTARGAVGAPGWSTLPVVPVARSVRAAVGPLVTRLTSRRGRLAGAGTGSPVFGGPVVGMRVARRVGVGAAAALTAGMGAGGPCLRSDGNDGSISEMWESIPEPCESISELWLNIPKLRESIPELWPGSGHSGGLRLTPPPGGWQGPPKLVLQLSAGPPVPLQAGW